MPSNTEVVIGLSVFHCLIVFMVYVGNCIFNGDPKNKKQEGKLFIKSLFWEFWLVFSLVKEIIHFIIWVFECVIALFKPDAIQENKPTNEEIKSTLSFGYAMGQCNEVGLPIRHFEPVKIVQKNVCSHCGSGKQYNSTCNRCGAPIV